MLQQGMSNVENPSNEKKSRKRRSVSTEVIICRRNPTEKVLRCTSRLLSEQTVAKVLSQRRLNFRLNRASFISLSLWCAAEKKRR